MYLPPHLQTIGRRNFLKAVAGAPALVALGAAAAWRGPIRGGPVRTGLIGMGDQGMLLLGQCRREYLDLGAVCDINPERRRQAAEAAEGAGFARPREYERWQDMLEREDLEAVAIATPLWTHAEIAVACLEAGRHVLCEKMMAWDLAGCERMLEAARRSGRVFEIGHQRFYNPMYQAAYENIIQEGALGDVYHIRLTWHRNHSWRRYRQPPAPDYDPDRWGYPTWEHLLNWRMYWRYSGGLLAELGSHQVAVANWFLDAEPESVHASGGVHRFKDGREVYDHVYVTWDYPHDRTVTFSSILSNRFDDYSEQVLGTKGTLILKGEREAFLFSEEDERATGLELSPRTADPVMDASESRLADAAGRTITGGAEDRFDGLLAYRNELAGFCAAIRTGAPLMCGPDRGFASARACILANEAIRTKAWLPVSTT